MHGGHHGILAGDGGTWVGFDPYWGYGSIYGAYPFFGGYGGSVATDFYSGGYTPFWGASPFGPSTVVDPTSCMAVFQC